MPSPLEYELGAVLFEDAGTRVYRGIARRNGQSVILKVLPPNTGTPRHRARLRNEYAMLAELDLPGVVKAIELLENDLGLVLVEEDIGGVPLNHRIAAGPVPLDEFFPIAIGLAEIIGQIHRQQIVHRDINPRNVVRNATTGRLQVIDFGLASRLSRELPQLTSPTQLEGSLPYLAPEQTGRINRAVDYRADFYSLGATFYELLTGQLPFTAADALEWVHCHIARSPRSPTQLVPGITPALSAIVLKLLAKLAEDRYQSADGLIHDLEQCRRQWTESGKIAEFALGSEDLPERFQLPQRLYGRESEVATLLATFDRVAVSGQAEMVLVAGFSGVGKSVLVAELHRPIVERRGYFISGKFDQYQRGIPYTTLAAAFHSLIQQLLTEPEDRVALWRRRLLEAVGENGQVLIDLMPQVELIIGPQPPATELPPDQAQHRLHAVFQRFVGVFTTAEHPLVIFLDDLQWIDLGSLKLIEQLATSPYSRYLLILGAYRDNEVNAAHPLLGLVDALRKSGSAQTTITLAPLAQSHVTDLLADALHCPAEHAELLSHLVYEKTRGNPFFCAQFLTALEQDGLLRFDRPLRRWSWDFAEIEARNFTDNVVVLMLGELERLPPMTQEAVAFGGFLGNQFPLTSLAQVLDQSSEATAEALWPALKAGLIVQQDQRYRFLHDRVQEAAFALTPAPQRAAVHAHIGRTLRDHATAEELESELFDILGHLNAGAAQITGREERMALAKLNLRAGRRARAATVHVAAVDYLTQGIGLLPADPWKQDYGLALSLHLALAECEYLSGNFSGADACLATILAQARSALDRAQAYLLQISLCMTRGENPAACDIVQVTLEELGLVLPARPSLLEVQGAHAMIARLMADRPLEQLLDLPPMNDPSMEMALRILVLASTAAIFTDQQLWSFQDAQMVLLCLRHGNADVSVMAYLFYGFMLGAYLQRYQEGYSFCEIAYALMEQRGLLQHRGNLVYHQALASLWVRPIDEGIAMLKDSIPMLVEYGNLVIACLAYRFIVVFAFLEGDSLDEVEKEAERCRVFAGEVPYPVVTALNRATLQLVINLRGRPVSPEIVDPSENTSDATDRIPFVIVAEHLTKLVEHCLMGRMAEARQATFDAEPLLWAIPGLLPNHDYYYYGSVALAANYEGASPADQSILLAKLRANLQQLRIWAENQPETFATSHCLVTAEIARITGGALEAIPWYEKAMSTARDGGLAAQEALACECAARFYRGHGAASIADDLLRTARRTYQRWGAEAKVRQMDEQYRMLAASNNPSDPWTTSSTPLPQLDALAVSRAARAISSQIVRDDLLPMLLQIVIEQAGAQTASLLLLEGEALTLAATADVERTPIHHRISTPRAPFPEELPVSIVTYVRRTQEMVLLEEARSPHPFSGDAYLAMRRPACLLTLPILRQNSTIGILYLEHRTASHVFSMSQIAVLEQLSAQAAISLDNAQLYEQSTQQADRLQLLNEIDRAILAATSMEDLCRAVFGRVNRLIPHTRVSVTLYETDREETLRFASRPDGTMTPAERLPMLTEVPGMFPIDRVGVVEDIRPEIFRHPVLRELRDAGIVGILSAPLVIDGQLRGRLNFSSDRLYAFTAAHEEIAGQLADQLAIATHQHELHEQTRLHAIDLEKRVAERTEELEAANKELESFAYSVSHDLRAPLRTIDGFTSMLAEDFEAILGPEGQRQCRIIRSQAGRMQQLIDDILSFSRLSRAPLHTQMVDQTKLVETVFAEVTQIDGRERIDFQLDPLPPALGDRALLAQVWVNLLSNAVKYSSKVPKAVIRVSATTDGEENTYQVQDNGAGFDMAYVDKLFGVFRRLHGEQEFPGTGVGLAIVQRIIQRHGGRIWAKSVVGQGATFTFTLPGAKK